MKKVGQWVACSEPIEGWFVPALPLSWNWGEPPMLKEVEELLK